MVNCQIVYTFADHPQGTSFCRDMPVLVDDNPDVDGGVQLLGSR